MRSGTTPAARDALPDGVAILEALKARVRRLAPGAPPALRFLADADVAFIDSVSDLCRRHGGAPLGNDQEEILDEIAVIDERWRES